MYKYANSEGSGESKVMVSKLINKRQEHLFGPELYANASLSSLFYITMYLDEYLTKLWLYAEKKIGHKKYPLLLGIDMHNFSNI